MAAWPFKNSGHNGQLTTLELCSRFKLPAFDIAVPGPTIRIARLGFRLQRALNCIGTGGQAGQVRQRLVRRAVPFRYRTRVASDERGVLAYRDMRVSRV